MKVKGALCKLIAGLVLIAASAPWMPVRASDRQASGTEKTVTGIVTDTMCGRTHMVKGKTAAECTRFCVKQGSKYALVAGQKLYTLEGHESDLYKLAGHRVSVKGKVNGDTIAVDSVTPAKRASASGL